MEVVQVSTANTAESQPDISLFLSSCAMTHSNSFKHLLEPWLLCVQTWPRAASESSDNGIFLAYQISHAAEKHNPFHMLLGSLLYILM